MTNLKKLALAAASVATLGMASASAAVVVSDGNGNVISTADSLTPPVLGAGTAFALNFDEGDLVDGQTINETITFVIGPDVDTADLTIGVLPSTGTSLGAQAGIVNFMAAVSVNGSAIAMLQVSDATGQQINANTFLDLLNISAGDEVSIELSGLVFENRGDDAEYSINVFGNAAPVPVPAAGLLFGTAIAGAAASRRKRKA